jgi:hypothetical protein
MFIIVLTKAYVGAYVKSVSLAVYDFTNVLFTSLEMRLPLDALSECEQVSVTYSRLVMMG